MSSIFATFALWAPIVLLAATTQELLHQAEAFIERRTVFFRRACS